MRDPLFPSARRAWLRQLPWWLAGLAFAVLGLMATAAWRAADAQRRDAEGARRQLAAEAAAQAVKRLREAEEAQPQPGQGRGTVAWVRQRWFDGDGQGERDGSGDGADWVFGPWPQAATGLSRKFEEAQTWCRSGKLAETARCLDEVSAMLSGNPSAVPPLPPTSSSPPAARATAMAATAGEKAAAVENPSSGVSGSGSSNGQGIETARAAAMESGAFTTAGLPLKPLVLRLRLALLSAHPETAATAPSAAGDGRNQNQDQARETKRRTVARELMEAALTFPSVLTSALVEEAAGELEKAADAQEKVRIAEARQRAAGLETLRQDLRQERGAVQAGARWSRDQTWHLERQADGAIAIRSRAELGRIAAAAGIGTGAGIGIGIGIGDKAVISAADRERSADWPLRALLDGVDVQGWPVMPEKVMASVSSGSWRVDAVCEDPASAFAGLDQQRRRQRWLIGGTAVFLTAAMAGFLGVLERQRRLNAMMSNFVAAVSHELRAPVASVGLLAERLHAGRVSGAEEQAKYHGLIEGECRRISATIENVLAFSRLERRQSAREFELSDLCALLADASRVFEAPAAERGVRLETTLPDGPVELEIDPVGIRQAVINLLDNALKFSTPGGTVRLRLEVEEPEVNAVEVANARARTKFRSTRHPAGAGLSDNLGGADSIDRADGFESPRVLSAVSITISDEGPGVPESESARIFDPFYRPGSELRRGTAGIGLGLAIVRATAQAHGGSISLRRHLRPDAGTNPGMGTGAEFTLRLVNPPALRP